jgi:hypothetical protein
MYREKEVVPEAKDDTTSIENRLLKYILALPCIDSSISAGRWSPFMVSAPQAVAACLIGDIVLMLVALAICVVLYVVAVKLSEPKVYRFNRLIALAPRIVFVVVLAMRVPKVEISALGALGLLVIMIGLAIDFIGGDFSTFLNYRYTCTYEIVKALPNRVFVVKQLGGAIGFNDESSYSGDQRLTIMGSMDSSQKLIADVEGLVVQLDPVTPELAAQIKEHQEDSILEETNPDPDDPYAKALVFLGLDVFNEECSNLHLLELAEQERERIMRENGGPQPEEFSYKSFL